MAESEVARLRARIEQQCQAMKAGLEGYAVVSRHDVINHKFDAIGRCQEQLAQFMGSEQAARIAVEIYQ